MNKFKNLFRHSYLNYKVSYDKVQAMIAEREQKMSD